MASIEKLPLPLWLWTVAILLFNVIVPPFATEAEPPLILAVMSEGFDVFDLYLIVGGELLGSISMYCVAAKLTNDAITDDNVIPVFAKTLNVVTENDIAPAVNANAPANKPVPVATILLVICDSKLGLVLNSTPIVFAVEVLTLNELVDVP